MVSSHSACISFCLIASSPKAATPKAAVQRLPVVSEKSAGHRVRVSVSRCVTALLGRCRAGRWYLSIDRASTVRPAGTGAASAVVSAARPRSALSGDGCPGPDHVCQRTKLATVRVRGVFHL